MSRRPALDPATARILEQAAAAALAGRTVILITHRLASAAGFDEIIVLDHGNVMERGTHGQLLESGGLYAPLWAAATSHKATRVAAPDDLT